MINKFSISHIVCISFYTLSIFNFLFKFPNKRKKVTIIGTIWYDCMNNNRVQQKENEAPRYHCVKIV